jgi:alkaline phosphatase D
MSPLNIDRRSVLGGALIGSLSAFAWPAFADGKTPFTQGIASGDPATDGFVLWTRLAPVPMVADGLAGMTAPAVVKWSVFADDAALKPVAGGSVLTSPDTAHTVHIEVDGLKSDRHYWYRFEAMGYQSQLGRARTLPLPGARPEQLKVAFASCSNYEKGYFSAYRHMADENPDFIMFLGDYIYETSFKDVKDTVRRHERLDDPRDLSGFRNRYCLYHLDADLQYLRANATSLVTWDDHEVQNDYGGYLSITMKDDVNMPAIRMAAYQAFYEAMPLRKVSQPIGGNVQLYKSYRFGKLAEINMLDGRQYRSAAACPVGESRKNHVANCDDRLDPARSLLGAAQEKWLYGRLAKSDAQWNILGQDILMTPFLKKGKDADGKSMTGYSTDTWDGYPASRTRLLEAMRALKVKNPVVFSGDLHSNWACELRQTPDAAPIATEFLGTSITSDPGDVPGTLAQLPENPQVKYYNGGTHGYVSVTLRADRMETRFQAISDRADPKATLSTEKAFVVETGRAGPLAL